MGQTARPTCLPHDKGQRTYPCFVDPLKTDKVMGWLKGELQPPK
jgi:hypothetical protein